LSPSPIPVEDSDSLMDEIDLFLATDELLPLNIKSEGYDSKVNIHFLKELLIDDSISLPNNESSDFEDDLLFPRPPPEPSNVEFFFNSKPEVISVMKNNIEELNEDNCFDPRGEIDVSTNVEDDNYFAFIFVIRIFLPYLIYPEVSPLLLSAKNEDTFCDPDFMGPFPSSKGNKYILVPVDYLSKWVEAKALPTNDDRVVVKFVKSLFSRFGIPRAIINDHGTYFCNDQFTCVMIKYGVTHWLATSYHSQTNGQVEVSNHGLKRILERTVGENRTTWSDKLDDALWAFYTAYKTPIGCTPYKLVYGKSCHIPIELEHSAYWALKHVNFDLKTAGDHRFTLHRLKFLVFGLLSRSTRASHLLFEISLGKSSLRAYGASKIGPFYVLKSLRVYDMNGKDYAKFVKNPSKPGNIGHEIESLHQKPDQRAFFYKDQATKAKC
nr:reverse transcriptase domain-containing protein [Tanacetum cinerariifolium]